MIILAYLIAIQIQSILSTLLMCGIIYIVLQIYNGVGDWKQWLLRISIFKSIIILFIAELLAVPCSLFVLQFLFDAFDIGYDTIHTMLFLSLILLPVCAKIIALYKIKKGQNP